MVWKSNVNLLNDSLINVNSFANLVILTDFRILVPVLFYFFSMWWEAAM